MKEENNKVTRITVDLSTSVKPIAISEEDALKKLEEDNKSQAQFKDDTIEIEPIQELEVEEEPSKTTNDYMKEINKNFDVDAFNKANQTLGFQTPEERKKQVTKVLIVLAIIIFIILLLELPAVIKNFR